MKDKVISIKKIGTLDKPADLFTKHLPRETIDKHLKFLGFSRQEGRHEIAPRSDYINTKHDEQQTVQHENSGGAKKVRWADLEGREEEEAEYPWKTTALAVWI